MRGIVLTMVALAVAILPRVADAAFTPAALVSGAAQIPFEEANSPAISEDGHYVVFRGSLAGYPGIYRRDLQTGAVALVAGVKLVSDASEETSPVPAPDASAPSVSADGRYVAFTTTGVLDQNAQPGSGCPQVFVRDMDVPLSSPQAYTLASALNGREEGLRYAGCTPARSAGELIIGGAQAAPAVALSADGRQVVFTVLSGSDLSTGPGEPPPTEFSGLSTEASQVVVRDLDSDSTTLVSVVPGGAPTPGGGAFPSTFSEQQGLRSISVNGAQSAASTAAISADGTTVSWLGTNVPSQVPSAADVTAGMTGLGPVSSEVEPLWRRVADGAAAVTRRVLDDSSLDLYFAGSHQITEAVNGGSLYPGGSENFVPPTLSADGSKVVVVANAPTATNQDSYAYLGYQPVTPSELYLVQLGDDVDTPPRVTPLTATPNFTASNAIFDGVTGASLSADGSRLVFNTRRTSFALAPPTLISSPVAESTYGYTYEVNVELGTLQRVTSTYDGSAPDGAPGATSLSSDGLTLAFSSAASNLFYGDGTVGASQVYLAQELRSPTSVAPESIGAPPLQLLPNPVWLLSATAQAQRDGSVLINAGVPGPGRLVVHATAQLPDSPRDHRSGKTKATKAYGAPARIVGQVAGVARRASELRLRLRLTARYRTILIRKKSLYCILSVVFTAPGHAQLAKQIPIDIRLVASPKPTRRLAAQPKRRGTKR